MGGGGGGGGGSKMRFKKNKEKDLMCPVTFTHISANHPSILKDNQTATIQKEKEKKKTIIK